MADRTLMKSIKNKEYLALTTKLLEASNGKKMGRTEGNAINLSDKPEDMYGKIMSLDDGFIDSGIELLTDLPLDTSAKNRARWLLKEMGVRSSKTNITEKILPKSRREISRKNSAWEIPAEIPVI